MGGVVARCRGHGLRQLGAGVGQECGVGPLLTDPVLEPSELGERDLVVGMCGQHPLVDLGGQPELPLVLHRGGLVQRPLHLLAGAQRNGTGRRLSRKSVGGEQRHGDRQRRHEAADGPDQEPLVPPPASAHRSVGHVGRAGAHLGGGGRSCGPHRTHRPHRPHRHGRCRARRSAGRWPGGRGRGRRRPECCQAGQVTLAERQVVGVRQVTGQVLGIRVGQRLGEEPPSLLECHGVGRPVEHVVVEGSVAPPATAHQDHDEHHRGDGTAGDWQHPDQAGPAAGRRVEHDGRAVAGDEVVLDLAVGQAVIDELAHRGADGDRRRCARHGDGQVLAAGAADDRLDGRGTLGIGRRRGGEDTTAHEQGDDQHHTEQRPQGEPTGPHAPVAFARAMSPSSWAAVTGATM